MIAVYLEYAADIVIYSTYLGICRVLCSARDYARTNIHKAQVVSTEH